jgi:3-hydroxyacyl-[acyl-carrier-protein] dehydratase
MPGVLIEGMAQTAGALCMRHRGVQGTAARLSWLSTKAVPPARVPGDTVYYHVQKMRNRGRVWRFRAQAHVDGNLVAEAEVSAVIVET